MRSGAFPNSEAPSLTLSCSIASVNSQKAKTKQHPPKKNPETKQTEKNRAQTTSKNPQLFI